VYAAHKQQNAEQGFSFSSLLLPFPVSVKGHRKDEMREKMFISNDDDDDDDERERYVVRF
jgi:hypothetical protein